MEIEEKQNEEKQMKLSYPILSSFKTTRLADMQGHM